MRNGLNTPFANTIAPQAKQLGLPNGVQHVPSSLYDSGISSVAHHNPGMSSRTRFGISSPTLRDTVKAHTSKRTQHTTPPPDPACPISNKSEPWHPS